MARFHIAARIADAGKRPGKSTFKSEIIVAIAVAVSNLAIQISITKDVAMVIKNVMKIISHQ